MGFFSRSKDELEEKKKPEVETKAKQKDAERDPDQKKDDEPALPPPIEWEADVDTFMEEILRLTDQLKRPLNEGDFRRLSASYSTLSQAQKISVANALYRRGLLGYNDAFVHNDYQRLKKRAEP